MGYRILLIGAYGLFGSRIAARLGEDAGLDLWLAGRRLARAIALRDALQRAGKPAALNAMELDVEGAGLGAALAAIGPDLVIHSAGPFQQRDYRVAEAALACGAHYLDLADGREFVVGISALDEAARRAGRWVISGASSVPALSAAVVAAHAARFSVLQAVHAAISPGNRTERGLATTEAILGYVGRPIPTLRDGRLQRVHGWQSQRRLRADETGVRWVGACDVPDLALFPERWPGLRDCSFRAGLELRRMHLGLWLLSWGVRLGLLRRPERWAALLLAISQRWQRLGSDCGLMQVDLHGLDGDGRPLRLRWQLIAEAGCGPEVPATAAVLLARRLARGGLPGAGARPCIDLFSLDDFLAELRGFPLHTRLELLDPA